MTRLVLNRPVRELRTSRRCLTGRVSLSSGRTASFESSLERDWLIALDFDPAIRLVREQPFSIQYDFEGKLRRYTPDVLAEFMKPHGQIMTTVYDIRELTLALGSPFVGNILTQCCKKMQTLIELWKISLNLGTTLRVLDAHQGASMDNGSAKRRVRPFVIALPTLLAS